MKIGVITIYDLLNYGNRLQNYALTKVLESYDIDVETLVLREYTVKDLIKKMCFRRPSNLNWNWEQETDEYYNSLDEFEKERYRKFDKFTKKYIKIKKYKYLREFPLFHFKYRTFIAGSDQIWNPFIGQAKGWEFVDFAPVKKRNAYAASFAVEDLRQYKDEIGKYLKKMNKISVREAKGAELVFDMTEKKVPVMPDPTLLLGAKEWTQLEKKPSLDIEKEYIVSFFLGRKSEKASQDLKNFQKKKLKILEVFDAKDEELCKLGVEEFLYLINHASLVLTDSFHACVFSFIFNTPFLVYERSGLQEKMTSRIDSFLKLYCLENRRREVVTDFFECDYAKGKKILEEEKPNARRYLRSLV